jgi:prepilin-type N-terminal cleavage/methylation domain-containing protein
LFFQSVPDISGSLLRESLQIRFLNFSEIMKRTPMFRRRASAGFTLIELLVVVAIIALLVAGSFSAYGFVMDKARTKGTLATQMALVNAIEGFYRDFTRFPMPTSGGASNQDVDTDTSGAEGMVTVLLGKDPTQNSRNIDYIGDMKAAKTQNGRQVDGLVNEENNYAIMDPWGNPYQMRIDANYDNELDNPNTEDRGPGRSKLRKRVLIWSAGKDRDPSTWKDNVNSWTTE